MKISDREYGAEYRVYSQTVVEMVHMQTKRARGDRRTLFLKAGTPPSMLHRKEFATPNHRGDICQAQTRYCRVSDSGAVNARTTWNVWRARKRGSRNRVCSARRLRSLEDRFRYAADGANVICRK